MAFLVFSFFFFLLFLNFQQSQWSLKIYTSFVGEFALLLHLSAVPVVFFRRLILFFKGKCTHIFDFSAAPVLLSRIYTNLYRWIHPPFPLFSSPSGFFEDVFDVYLSKRTVLLLFSGPSDILGYFFAFLSTKCMFYVFVVSTELLHSVISVPVFFLSTNLTLNLTRLGGPRESGICYNTSVALKLVRWQWTGRACSWHHWTTRWWFRKGVVWWCPKWHVAGGS